jgi:TPR repeat protein
MVVFAGGHSRWYFADEMIFGKMTRFGEINIPKIKAEPWRVIKLARPHETVALGMVYQPISVEVKRASAQEQYEKGEKFYYEAENYEEAVKWYRKAAEQGHANAQFYLGVLYHTGRGVEQNYEEAIKWLRKATAQDFGPAQYLMGHLYRDGNGVEKNYEEAVKWYRKAAEQGSEYAQNQLGFHYSEGLGVEKDNYEAVKWFRKAAEQGHVDAQASMGYAYYFGEGVEENHNEAVNWYRKAAEQGCEDSRDILEQIYDAGYTGPQDDDGAGAASTQKTRNIKIERKKQFTGAANVHKVSINGEYVCDLRGGEIVNCAAMSDTAEIDFVDALKFNFTTRLNLRLHGDSAYVHVHMGGFMSDFDLKFDVRGAEVVSIQGVYADGSIREM